MENLKGFIDISKNEFSRMLYEVDTEKLKRAADIIIEAEKSGCRLHITGIGKPAYVAGYISSLISSIGMPTYFLHGTEAVHGSCGQLRKGDVVICISNSGETAELKATVMAIKNNDGKIIAVTGNTESWLGKNCDVCLKAFVDLEGGPLNRAPRMSIISETFILQCLSIILQDYTQITPEEYVKRHPGGSLGKLRESEM